MPTVCSAMAGLSCPSLSYMKEAGSVIQAKAMHTETEIRLPRASRLPCTLGLHAGAERWRGIWVERPACPCRGSEVVGQAAGKTLGSGPRDHRGIVGAKL